jgi:chromosome segregation ATPase
MDPLSFTVLETPVNLRPVSDAITQATATAQQKKQEAVATITGLMRTVTNRNAQIQEVRGSLGDAIDEVDGGADEHDAETGTVQLVTILKGQRDTALEARDQAQHQAAQSAHQLDGVPAVLEQAFADEEEELEIPASVAGQIGLLVEQRDAARVESRDKDALIQQAQSQLELMAARIAQLQQRLLQLNGSMGDGMDALLAQAANLTDE